jgi:hypothetical protein
MKYIYTRLPKSAPVIFSFIVASGVVFRPCSTCSTGMHSSFARAEQVHHIIFRHAITWPSACEGMFFEQTYAAFSDSVEVTCARCRREAHNKWHTAFAKQKLCAHFLPNDEQALKPMFPHAILICLAYCKHQPYPLCIRPC